MYFHKWPRSVGYYVAVPYAELIVDEPESAAPPYHRPWLRRFTGSPRAFWVTFIGIHGVIAMIGNYFGGFGDVYWYGSQMRRAMLTGIWPGIDVTFVYPGASLPVMLIPAVFGQALYFAMWMVLVTVLNSAAALSILGWRPNNTSRLWLCWWWAAFLLLLGPVAVGRVDSVSVPIVIMALGWLWRRPTLSGALLAFGGWIKIWPIAIFGALFVLLRRRWNILVGAVAFSCVIIAVYFALGADFSTLFGFIASQNDRGVQAEAVAATPFLWIGVFGGDAGIVWNAHLLTNEVYGAGTDVVGAILSPLMAVSAIGFCVIAYLARRNGARIRRILPPLMLGLVLTLIVFNKVGSPQFMSWLAAPIIVGLLLQQRGFDVPARYALIIALLTQIIFPTIYLLFTWLNPALVIIGTIRNGLLVFLLGWSAWQLVVALREARRGWTRVVIDRYSDPTSRSSLDEAPQLSSDSVGFDEERVVPVKGGYDDGGLARD